MGLLTTEINELRKLLADYKDGKIESENLKVQLAIYQQTEKRVSDILKACAIGVKVGAKAYGKKTLKEIAGNAEDIIEKLPLYDRTKERGRDD